MLPGAMWVTAVKGIMVSAVVLTAEPVEAVLLPVLPMELRAWLRTALEAAAATAGVADTEDPEHVEADDGDDIVDEAAGVAVEDVRGVKDVALVVVPNVVVA